MNVETANGRLDGIIINKTIKRSPENRRKKNINRKRKTNKNSRYTFIRQNVSCRRLYVKPVPVPVSYVSMFSSFILFFFQIFISNTFWVCSYVCYVHFSRSHQSLLLLNHWKYHYNFPSFFLWKKWALALASSVPKFEFRIPTTFIHIFFSFIFCF